MHFLGERVALVRTITADTEEPPHLGRPRHIWVVGIDLSYLLFTFTPLWPFQAEVGAEWWFTFALRALLLVSAIHHWLSHTEQVNRLDQWCIWNYISVLPLVFTNEPELLWTLWWTLVFAGFVLKVMRVLPSEMSDSAFLMLGCSLFTVIVVDATFVSRHFTGTLWLLFVLGCACYLYQLWLYQRKLRTRQHAVLMLGCTLHAFALQLLHAS